MTQPERQERRVGLSQHILKNVGLIDERMRKRGIEIVTDPDMEAYVTPLRPLVPFDNRARTDDAGHIFRVSYRDQLGRETEGEVKQGAQKVKKIWTEHENIKLFNAATAEIRDTYARPAGEAAERVQAIIRWANRHLSNYQAGVIRPEDLENIREETAKARVQARTDTAVKPNLVRIDEMMEMVGQLDSYGSGRFNPMKDEMVILQILRRAVHERIFGEAAHNKYDTLYDEGEAVDAEAVFNFKVLRAEIARIGRLSPRSREFEITARNLDAFAHESLPKIAVQPYLTPALILTLLINGDAVTGDEIRKLTAIGVENPMQYFNRSPVYMIGEKARRQSFAEFGLDLIDRTLEV